MQNEPRIVWLTEYRHFAQLVAQHSYYSVVRYSRDGIEYETEIGNDEWEDAFDYEQD